MSKPGFFSYEHPSYPAHMSANVILTTFLAIFSSVTTMLGDSSIQGELALSGTESVWITTLYLLGANTTVPTGNWFANQFGFNRIYTYGVAIFTLAALTAALSTNFFMIAAARFVEGVGAGFIFPVGLALISQSVSKKRIGLVINLYIGLGFGAGLSLGALVAGYFVQFYSWRDLFFLIVPIGAVAMIPCWLSRPKKPDLHKTPFDFFGFLTFTSFIASLLIALTLGPIRSTPEGWRTPYILLLFGIAILSLISCITIERKHPNPLFPVALFKDSIFSIGLGIMFLFGMAAFVSVAISIQYMLDHLFYEKWVTGKIASVYGLIIGVFSIIANALAKIIPTPVLTFSGLFFLIFSYFYNNELSWLTGYTQVITILLIRGIGIGLALGPTTLVVLREVADSQKTAAATILTFFRQIGATYGSTLIALFSIRQTIFHTARFAEQTNPQLPAYRSTFQNLFNKFPDKARAKAAIVKNITTQAEIQGLNDSLILFGYITSAAALILALFLILRAWRRRFLVQRADQNQSSRNQH